jgi:hypothetical protein
MNRSLFGLTVLAAVGATAGCTRGDGQAPRALESVGGSSLGDGGLAFRGPSPWADVTAWGAAKDCSADAAGAIQAAIHSLAAGGTVFFPPGTYCISQPIRVLNDNVLLRGSGKATILQPFGTTPPVSLIQFSASDGGVQELALNCANAPGQTTSGLAVIPASVTPSQPENQNRNRFSGLQIAGCGANAILLQAGPLVATNGSPAASGCWFNAFYDIHILYSGTAILFANPLGGCVGTGQNRVCPSSVNRNQFYSVVADGFVTNGVDIEAGATNTFYGCSFSGIAQSAISIAKSSTVGADNNDNRFFGTSFEANGTDVDNSNLYTHFFGSPIDLAKVRGAAPIATILGQADAERFVGYDYKSTDGVARWSTVGGVEFQTSVSVDSGKTCSIGGGTTHDSLAVGPPVSAASLGVSSLASFAAPDSNWGFASTFVADGVGRGVEIVSQDYDVNNAGSALAVGPTGIIAYQNGDAFAPLKVLSSSLYLTNAGSGLIQRSPNGTCWQLAVSDTGAVSATKVACL